MNRYRFVLLQLAYDVGASMLVIPALLTFALGLSAFVLQAAELRAGTDIPLLAMEPGAAQTTIATLAGSMMTVISVVYSVLLVALSLASTQFSTRILAGMVRDRVSQVVLGVFLGTFVWQLVALRSIHLDPPWVPPLTVTGAVGLAVASLVALVLFISRVIHNLQANNIVDRIARETEHIVDEVFPPPADGVPRDADWPDPPADAKIVRSAASGYVQLVSIDSARAVAAGGLRVHLLRPMGSFVPAGAGLWAVYPPDRCTGAVEDALRSAVDLGPIRTMQQDAEWGLRQIVDIGLKAISPAVNDPSTGGLCIDHLSRLLIRAGTRGTPRSRFPAGEGEAVVPGARYTDLVDLAFEQLRQYGRSDMAINLRLMRAIGDVAEAVEHPQGRDRLHAHACAVARAARLSFPDDDRSELDRRAARAEKALGRAVG
jgi:uncharacterized membrane protein